MMGRDSGQPAVAGGPARHIPVLGRQAIELLAVRDGGIYIDGTFGAGGHSRLLLAAGARVIGIDRDQTAIALGADLVEQTSGRLILVQERFSQLDKVAREQGFDAVDGVVLDLGISSMQLDQAERGFSFRLDGPLDMRMDRSGPSASDLLSVVSERDLAAIIATLGEERFSRPVARAIVAAGRAVPIRSTKQLAEIVAGVVRARPGEIHPATRTFQALRIFLNDELGELVAGLAAAERALKPSGRLVLVSFHSLEDRIVKTFLTDRSQVGGGSRHLPETKRPPPTFRVLTKRPIAADEQEVARNPRARSAKLRAAERTAAPPRGNAVEHLLPNLPSLAAIIRGR
jgi:16S rRNA (cytosine1402-N4)-methyltransferase